MVCHPPHLNAEQFELHVDVGGFFEALQQLLHGLSHSIDTLVLFSALSCLIVRAEHLDGFITKNRPNLYWHQRVTCELARNEGSQLGGLQFFGTSENLGERLELLSSGPVKGFRVPAVLPWIVLSDWIDRR